MNTFHVSQTVHCPRDVADGPLGPSGLPHDQAESTPWSTITPSTIYLEKLRLLCHSQQELRGHGYITDQLSESQLESKRRCRKCGARSKAPKRRPARPKPSLGIQDSVSDAGMQPENRSLEVRQERRMVCRYHAGKVFHKQFLCCGQHVTAPGCIAMPVHNWEDMTPSFQRYWRFHHTQAQVDRPFHTAAIPGNVTHAHHGFLAAQARHSPVKAIALDCEMGTAASGDSELIRITAIDFFTFEPLVDRLVYPAVPMQHYNTRFSGVTAASMRRAVRDRTCLFGRDAAREELMKFIDRDTIVVVHGGHNDFAALRWTHAAVVDNFILESYRAKVVDGGRSLKALCAGLLGVRIQEGKGHDSLEDAAACRELVHRWVLSIPDRG